MHRKEPVAISLRPDSSIRLNLTQLIIVVAACLSGAFASGIAWMKLTSHVEDSNHVMPSQLNDLSIRITVLETKIKSLEKGN